MVDDKPQLEIQHPYLKLPDLELVVKHNSMAGVVNTVLKMFNGMIVCWRKPVYLQMFP